MDNEILDVYPVRAMEYEEKDGIITVLFINPKPPNFFEKLLFKKQINKPKKIDLDNIGSFIWNNCTGSKQVKEIIELTKEHFGESLENVEDRVIVFIKQLNKTRLINLFKKERV